jgi:hypothetical protein
MRKRFAVIPTHDRPEEFARCVAAIRPQVDRVIAVCHGEEALIYALDHDIDRVPYMVEGRANISAMWNLGLDEADAMTTGPYDIAVLNDDAIPASDWFEVLTYWMHFEGADGVSERRGPGRDFIAGWAFILNGEAGIRADEQFVHWYGDDDLQRQGDPWCFVDGITTPNTRAMTTSRSPEARAQIALDRAAFEAKYPA